MTIVFCVLTTVMVLNGSKTCTCVIYFYAFLFYLKTNLRNMNLYKTAVSIGCGGSFIEFATIVSFYLWDYIVKSKYFLAVVTK